MKLSLLVLAATAATVLAAPADTTPDALVEAAPGDFVVTTNNDGTAATAVPADSSAEHNEEKRDLEEDTHDLAKRWWGDGGWIACRGQWWEYGKKRVAVQYTGITDNPRMFQYFLQIKARLTVDNFQDWWRNDLNVMEINWGFPDSETARQIQFWKDMYGITCHW